MTSTPVKGVRGAVARWNALDLLVRDGVFTAVLAPLAFAPAMAPLGAEFGDLAKRPYDVPGVLVALLLWLPLVARRRWPGWCLAFVAGAFAVHQLAAYPASFASVGLYIALYSAGAHGRRADGARLALVPAGAVGLYVLFVLGLHDRGSPLHASDFLLIPLALICCWAAGRAVRARQAGEEERRRLSVDAAMARERARIARELHDVVTHHVTAMTVQADAAQFLLADSPDRVATGLGAISDSGRRALTDLQHLLGLLNASDDPTLTQHAKVVEATPHDDASEDAVRLSDLVEKTRAAGQPVELTQTGQQPPTASGVGLAAYRVVQESLTNALKHAPGRRTRVTVQCTPDDIEVEVSTEGAEGAPATSATPATLAATGVRPLGRGGGHGLIGLRERVGVFGGELLAGARPDGGFAVSARIPIPSGEHAVSRRRSE